MRKMNILLKYYLCSLLLSTEKNWLGKNDDGDSHYGADCDS